MSVGGVLTDAWHVYTLLFRRSVIVASVVYFAIAALEVTNGSVATALALLAALSGPVLVQGALVLIVRNVHEGEKPAEIGSLFRAAGGRFPSLFGASIVYGLGILFGLIAFIVPGLIAAARWCLLAPGIMLEGRRTFGAIERSRELVRGRTWPVFWVLALSFLLTAIIPGAIEAAVFGFETSHLDTFAGAVVSAVTAPYAAHVLSVLYYRLTDPDRPTIDPVVREWPSVWKGPA
jgi:hypothetical protein